MIPAVLSPTDLYQNRVIHILHLHSPSLLSPLIRNRKFLHATKFLLPGQWIEPVVVAVTLVDVQAAAQDDPPSGVGDYGTIVPGLAEFVGQRNA